MISQISKLRTTDHGLKTGKWKRNTELKIETWNVTSLFRTGACQNLADVLNTYKIDTVAIQKVRWLVVGQIDVGVIYYSETQKTQFQKWFRGAQKVSATRHKVQTDIRQIVTTYARHEANKHMYSKRTRFNGNQRLKLKR